VYVDSQNGRGIAVDPAGEGDVTKTHVKWQIAKTPDALASPIVAGDFVYRAHRPGLLKCWKLATGELLFDERLEGIPNVPSPIAPADGRVHFATPALTYAIKAGPKLEVLAKNPIQNAGADYDQIPSAAVSAGRIYFRNTSTLFCIGKRQ